MWMLILLSVACLFAGATAGDIEEFLKTNPEPVLKDEAKWKVLFECLMDNGPCGEYQVVKDTLPKLVTTKCEKCNPAQKESFEKILKQFVEKYPKDYVELTNKFGVKPEEN